MRLHTTAAALAATFTATSALAHGDHVHNQHLHGFAESLLYLFGDIDLVAAALALAPWLGAALAGGVVGVIGYRRLGTRR